MPYILGKTLYKLVPILPSFAYCSYASSCKAVLTEVYEGLMLPLPPSLSNSPEVASSMGTDPVNPHAPTSCDSEEEDVVMSLPGPLALPKLPPLSTRGYSVACVWSGAQE